LFSPDFEGSKLNPLFQTENLLEKT